MNRFIDTKLLALKQAYEEACKEQMKVFLGKPITSSLVKSIKKTVIDVACKELSLFELDKNNESDLAQDLMAFKLKDEHKP